MKAKFELSVTFDYEDEPQAVLACTFIKREIEKAGIDKELGNRVGISNISVKQSVLDLTNSVGDELFGNFNPTGDPFVEEVKERCARVYDIIEKLQTNGRVSATIKTNAQTHLLDCQMDAVKVRFLPKNL